MLHLWGDGLPRAGSQGGIQHCPTRPGGQGICREDSDCCPTKPLPKGSAGHAGDMPTPIGQLAGVLTCCPGGHMLQVQPRVAERALSHLQALELFSDSQSMLIACLQQPGSQRPAEMSLWGSQGKQEHAGGRRQAPAMCLGCPARDVDSCVAQDVGWRLTSAASFDPPTNCKASRKLAAHGASK